MALKTGKKSLIGFALREKVMLNPMTHNPFQTLEQHLAEIVRQAQRSQWLAENKSALDEYNRRIELRGTFIDGLRRF